MNRFVLFTALSLSLVACGGSHQEVKAPVAVVPERKEVCTRDNFDKAGNLVADGARWSYNKAGEAYDWATSEENKKRATEAWETLKKKTQELNSGK